MTELFNVMPETQLTPDLNNELAQQKGNEVCMTLVYKVGGFFF